MALTPEQRSMRARIAAHSLHATHDSRSITQAARGRFLERFYREVDPDGELDLAERERRAAHARSAYFTRLALRRSIDGQKRQMRDSAEAPRGEQIDSPRDAGSPTNPT